MWTVNLEALSWIGGSVGAVTGIAALIISIYFTRRATSAAESAALSATKTAEIEAGRRHGELTPEFVATVAQRNSGGTRAVLALTLKGPVGLHNLDEIEVRIRSDQPPTSPLAGGRSQQEMDETIWAPYRLAPGIDDSDKLGKVSATFAMRRGEVHKFDIEPTLAPAWIDASGWASRYDEAPIQLEVRCLRNSFEPWTVLVDVEQPQAKFDVQSDLKSSGSTVLTYTNVGNSAANDVEFLDNSGNVPRLTGNFVHVLPPGERTQQVWIADTFGSTTEWIKLSWTDMRGARQSLTRRLP
jgi:hypothetical protein